MTESTQDMRYAPGLVVVGPQRTGSTWLYEALKHHPGLVFPKHVKETMFLDVHFDRGWAWYDSLFDAGSHGLRAEVGPTYFHSEEAATRLHRANPAARVVIAYRDPVERAVSLYLHHLKRGRVADDFDQAVRDMPEILTSGRYAVHGRRWESLFGDAVQWLDYADIANAPEALFARVVDHAGLPAIDAPPTLSLRINESRLPSSPRVAAAVTAAGAWLRRHDLHRVVEFGKALGGSRIYSGNDVKKHERVTNSQRAELEQYYSEDVAFAHARLAAQSH